MIGVIVVADKKLGIYDEALSGHQNRSRVWQIKWMHRTHKMWALDFFGAGLGEVQEPEWWKLYEHPAVYMRATETGPNGDLFDEIRMNLDRIRKKAK